MWDSNEQVIQTFGRKNLVRLSADNVGKLLLPEKSKIFLIDIGLPKGDVLMCKFDVSRTTFPTIQEYAERKGMQCKVKQQYRLIGCDGHRKICLHEGLSKGEVVAINISEDNTSCFMNSSIELLCGFLALYIEDYCRHAQLTDDELNKLAFKFEEKIREHDSQAFNSSNNWWPRITSQMKNGLL